MILHLPNALARILREFFATHLSRLRGLSRHTVLSYRDRLALLLRFAAQHHAQPVVALNVSALWRFPSNDPLRGPLNTWNTKRSARC